MPDENVNTASYFMVRWCVTEYRSESDRQIYVEECVYGDRQQLMNYIKRRPGHWLGQGFLITSSGKKFYEKDGQKCVEYLAHWRTDAPIILEDWSKTN